MPMPRKPDPKKHCKACGARMFRKRLPSGDLEAMFHFMRRRFCDQACMGEGTRRKTVGKQAHMWRARKHRKPACERCGRKRGLHVHHKDRDWTNDDATNLETLCNRCHGRLHWEEDQRRENRRRRMLVPIDAVNDLAAAVERLPKGTRGEFRRLVLRLRGAVATATPATGFDF